MRFKILINALPLVGKRTGIGNYVYEICRRLTRFEKNFSYIYYYGFFSKKLHTQDLQVASQNNILPFIAKLKEKISKYPILKKTIKNAILNLPKLVGHKFDLYWEPNFIPFKEIPSKFTVVTVHDFSIFLYPDWHPKERVEYFKAHFRRYIDKANKIITDSEFIKQQTIEFLDCDPNKIESIYLGVDHNIFKKQSKNILNQFLKRKKLPSNFILFIGSIEPRKNLERLLLAYIELPNYLKQEYKLLLAGFSGWNNEKILNLIEKEKKNILYLGYVSTQELVYLYNLATIFVYPSLYEGFGLPPLEAMACGTPVVVSNVSSLPEVCGNAALYVDPYDINDINQKLQMLLNNIKLRNELSYKGLNHAQQFNWDKTTREHLAVFSRLLTGKK